MLQCKGGFNFGNYLTAFANMLYYIEKTGETVLWSSDSDDGMMSCFMNCIVKKASKDWLSIDTDVSISEDLQKEIVRSDVDFYYGFHLAHNIPPPSDADRRRLIQQYIVRYLPPLLPMLPDSSLVIQIRSGDLFSGGYFHPKYIQPPLAYYRHIIDTHPEYTRILIVTQPDKKNPVIQPLLDQYGDRISIQSLSIQEDVQLLLSARNLVVGTGSFGMQLAYCSTTLRRLFCFERHNLWYPDAPYEIIVKGVTNTTYPHEWAPWVLHHNILLREDFIVETLDPSSFTPPTPKRFWDQ